MSVLEIDRRNILMCGDRFKTVQIYIQNKIDKRTQKKLKEALDAKLKHRYVTHLISSEIKKLKVTCGMPIHFQGRHGTLGGFAEREDDHNLYALLSRHVAKHLTDFQLGLVHAEVITPHTRKIDIASAKINPTDKFQVDKNFKDIYDRPRKCTLFRYTNENVSQTLELFDIVFIRGATTSIGQGEIMSFSVEHDGLPILRIRNRADKPHEDFCQPGDSGAIVCSTTRDGFMYALAIIVGENVTKCTPKDQKEYMAYMLMDGLDELSKTHKCTYRLCEDSVER